ncbi:MAG: fibronectin type III domain-containing protein, partial [Spirochaetes bacterium]|nr:fibronectin type III domain-containing protein [Spirochaetota bacterium]
TTDTGREKGEVAVPMIGSALSGPLAVGPKYTGFLDELRVSRRFVEAPSLARFPGQRGTAVSRLLDLGHAATRVVRIETVQSTPSDSAVFCYYRLSDELGRPASASAGAEAGWIPFAPGAGLPDTARGRYLQVMAELFPDGRRAEAPSLSSIRIVYEPHLPPLAPAGLTATPGNGKVSLSWRRVDDPEVKGYEVYYGGAPGSYFGVGAAQGASPLDAGNVTQMEITGLENGALYYFSVTAYDGAEPRQRSLFSVEVGARPSRIHP